MKNIFTTTLLVAVLTLGQNLVVFAEDETAASQNNILITEIQTGGASSQSEEFVEIYNPNSFVVDITGWKLQYRPASYTSSQSWAESTTKAEVACSESLEECPVTIGPKDRITFVRDIDGIDNSIEMEGGFSNKGGQIRLIQPTEDESEVVVQDFVGYGTAVDAEGSPASAPANGYSIKRIIDDQQEPIDTNDNSYDFLESCGEPTPGQSDWESDSIPLESGCYITTLEDSETTNSESTTTESTTAASSTESGGMGNGEATTASTTAVVYAGVIITELLPNPKSPELDSEDEFIEIYNPNSYEVNLSGYILQSGSEYRYSYTIENTSVAAYGYVAITSETSNLSLSNSGTSVRLLDPNENIIYEVASYGTAKEGLSWMQDETGWHWTTTPTPGTTNMLTLATTTSSSSSSKSTTGTSSSSASSATAPTSTKSSTNAEDSSESESQATESSLWKPQYWLIVGVGTIVLSYVIYEYRREIKTGFAKIKKQFITKSKMQNASLEDEQII